MKPLRKLLVLPLAALAVALCLSNVPSAALANCLTQQPQVTDAGAWQVGTICDMPQDGPDYTMCSDVFHDKLVTCWCGHCVTTWGPIYQGPWYPVPVPPAPG
jgi:hypothetical protein